MSHLLLTLLLLSPAAEPAGGAAEATTVEEPTVEERLRRLERALGLSPVDEATAAADADADAGADIPAALDDTTLLRQAIRDVRLELLRLDQRLDALERGGPALGGSASASGGAAYDLRRLEREVADLRWRLRSLEMHR